MTKRDKTPTLAQLRKLAKRKGYTHAHVVKLWGVGDWCATVFKGQSSECFVSHADKDLCVGAMFAALSALPEERSDDPQEDPDHGHHAEG